MNECEYCDAESGGRSVDRALSGEVILTSESWQCGSWRNTSSDATCKPIHYRSDRCRIRQLTAERDALRERLSVAEKIVQVTRDDVLHDAEHDNDTINWALDKIDDIAEALAQQPTPTAEEQG
jgi:hypothetical protein